MRNFSSDQRGISSIVGFLLVVVMLVGFGSYVLAVKGRQVGIRAEGLVDAMRQAEKRQQQLLTFVHAHENSATEELRTHFYNYGTGKINLDKLWVNGQEVLSADITFEGASGTSPENVFYARKLTVVVVKNIHSYAPSSLENYAFTFLTESNSLYSYLVGRG